MKQFNAVLLLAGGTILLVSGCGGGGSSSPTSTAPTTATIAQATALTQNQMSSLRALMPTSLVPASAFSGTSPRLVPLALSFSERKELAEAVLTRLSPLRKGSTTPCSPDFTEVVDGSGFTIDTWNYSSCTDGNSGSMMIKYKYTTTTWYYEVAYNNLRNRFAANGHTYDLAANGSLTFSGTDTPSAGIWDFTYRTGSTGMTFLVKQDGSTLGNATFRSDLTATWVVTSSNPVVATFTTSGTWSQKGSWLDETGVVASGNFGFTIQHATPLVWQYDASTYTNCVWPLSGRINITNGSQALGITFTSTCGTVVLDPGGTRTWNQ